MTWDKISGVLRHALTFGGGYLVAKGLIPEAMLNDAIAAVMVLGGVIWSVIVKPKAV